MKNSRSPILLIILVLLTLIFVTPVLAAKPDIQTFPGTFSYTIQCDGFQLEGEGEETLRVATFYDNDGNPIRMQLQVKYDGRLTNPETGQTLRDPQYAMLTTDLQKETDTFVGLIYRLTVPGSGVVYLDVGRIVFSVEGVIFEAGPHQFLNGSEEPICAIFE